MNRDEVMTNKNEKYLWIVKAYNKDLDSNFPGVHLGVGDRLIVNSIITKQADFFTKYTGEITYNYSQYMAIISEMREFGFNPERLPEEICYTDNFKN